jgi:hypothetical protein
MARIQAIGITEPSVADSGHDPLNWEPIRYASDGAFVDDDYPEPRAGERRFYTVAVKPGVSNHEDDVGCVAVLGVTRDLEIGYEKRLRATVGEDGNYSLQDYDRVPPAFCAPEPADSEIPTRRRGKYARVLEHAHGLDMTGGGVR